MALSFNGSTDYLTVAAPFHGASALTVSTWVQFTSLASENKIMGVWQEGGSGFEWLLTTSGTALLGAIVDNGANFHTPSGGTLTTATWQQVAISYNGTTMKAWLNGVSVGSASFSLPTQSTATLLSFGGGLLANSSPEQLLGGALAETGIWNVGLTDSEMKSLGHFSPLRVRLSSLKRYRPFVRNTNDLISGVAVTSFGTPGYATHPPVFR